MKYLFIFMFMFSTSLFAFDASVLKGMKKQDISGSLDNLVASGMITKEQAEKAKEQLSGMSDKDVENLKSKAVKEIQTNPSIVKKLQSK